MENADSWNEMIFGYIRAKKDWLSAHILKNRLEHKNDLAQIEVEANEATDLKVRKRIYLDKRVNTQNTLPFDTWCTERMNKTSSTPKNIDEKVQTGWNDNPKHRSSKLSSPTSNYENVQDGDKSKPKYESSANPLKNSDEKVQTGWETKPKHVSSKPSSPTNNDESSDRRENQLEA